MLGLRTLQTPNGDGHLEATIWAFYAPNLHHETVGSTEGDPERFSPRKESPELRGKRHAVLIGGMRADLLEMPEIPLSQKEVQVRIGQAFFLVRSMQDLLRCLGSAKTSGSLCIHVQEPDGLHSKFSEHQTIEIIFLRAA